MPPAASLAGRRVFGLIRIGRVRLAVPIQSIQEVVRGPLDLAALPRAARHVLGLFTWHDRPVPVIDLADLVRGESEPVRETPPAYALVVRHETGWFAVQIDEALGIVNATTDEVLPFEDDPSDEDRLFTEVYQPTGQGAPAAVIDWTGILARRSVRRLLATSAIESPHQSEPTRNNAPTLAGAPHVLVRVRGRVLAFAADAVRRVQRRPAQFDSELRLGQVMGYLQHDGINLPVLDLGAYLGWPATAADAPTPDLTLVGQDDRCVAFPVEEVIALPRIPAAQISPADEAETQAAQPGLLAGLWRSDHHGPVRLVDVAVLERLGWGDADHLADYEATTAGNLAHEIRRKTGTETKVEETPLFLVAGVGGAHLAIPARDVREVTALPVDWRPEQEDGVFRGLLELRGRPVKIFDLASALSIDAPTMPRRTVILAGDSADLRGWLVGSMDLMVRQTPQPLPARPPRRQGLAPVFLESVRARGEGWVKEVCVLDLAGLNRHVAEA